MVLVPETRFEAFLAKIAGQEGPDLEPITRTEAFLDDIADGENNLEPRTRFEYWLQKIAENAGGGGIQSVTGVIQGNDSLNLTFSCAFYPRVLSIRRADSVSISDRIASGFIGFRDNEFHAECAFQETAGSVTMAQGSLEQDGIIYNADAQHVTAHMPAGRPWSSATSYKFLAIGWED